MNKELKSLLILSLLTAPIGVVEANADGPGYRPPVQSQAPSAPAMGEYAGPERTQAAMGHYARARTLLVEAMREFEAGKDIAKPDLILNSETWKAGVSARADELGHVISPEARESTGGTRFKENHSLLNENFDKPKKFSNSAPRPVKKVEKKEVLVSAEEKESNFARARMNEDSELTEDAIKESKTTAKVKRDLEPVNPLDQTEPSAKKTDDEKDLNELLAQPKKESNVDLGNTADSEGSKDRLADETAPPSDTGQTAGPSNEDTETAKSINDDEIRARLKKLSEEIAQEEKSKR